MTLRYLLANTLTSMVDTAGGWVAIIGSIITRMLARKRVRETRREVMDVFTHKMPPEDHHTQCVAYACIFQKKGEEPDPFDNTHF